PFLVRRYARSDDLRALFWAISVAFAFYGLSYAVVPWMPSIYLAGLFVFFGHFGGGAQWTLSSYGLQVIVPDHIRGRIVGFDEGLITFTMALSATLAGRIADYVSVKVVMLGLTGVTLTLHGRVDPRYEGDPPLSPPGGGCGAGGVAAGVAPGPCVPPSR